MCLPVSMGHPGLSDTGRIAGLRAGSPSARAAHELRAAVAAYAASAAITNERSTSNTTSAVDSTPAPSSPLACTGFDPDRVGDCAVVVFGKLGTVGITFIAMTGT
jgi:hypothetical protein